MKAMLSAFLVCWSVAVMGQNLIPPFEYKNYNLQVTGYGQGFWSDHDLPRDNHGRSAAWQSLVTRLDLKTPNPNVRLFGEFEFWGITQADANWVQQAFLEVRANDSLTFRFGRMLLSSGYVTPPPDLLETVYYPRTPYSVYGNGIQMEAKLSETWKFITDVTGIPHVVLTTATCTGRWKLRDDYKSRSRISTSKLLDKLFLVKAHIALVWIPNGIQPRSSL